MDVGCDLMLTITGSSAITPMKCPVFLALAMLVSASPLPARGSVLSTNRGFSGEFCELTVGQLADAAGQPALPGLSVAAVSAGATSTAPTEPPKAGHGLVTDPVDCEPGGVVPALQSSRTEARPATPDQVPEPSAVLLLIGAAAWILLRRKL